MTKSKKSIILFSKELALSSEEKQHESLTDLWEMVCEIKFPPKHQEKIKKDFALFFTGGIELYRQYADAAGVLFTPEVARIELSKVQRNKIEAMGFEVI